MDKWCVRYVNLCGEQICYDVYADDQCDAWSIADRIFHAENPEKTKGFELEGVYHYD